MKLRSKSTNFIPMIRITYSDVFGWVHSRLWRGSPSATDTPSQRRGLRYSDTGFTLIDVLVGTFLILIVFLGIFGAYQLGLKVVGQSRNRITATSIANGKIEQVRNLPYESIGVAGEFPDGVLEPVTAVVFNNIEYKIETRVDFVIDEADGIAPPDDDCPNDYKRVEIKVSWTGRFLGQVKLVTDIVPKNLAQECAIGGGILLVSVFDAYGIMVSSPLIEVKDPITDQILKTATPSTGEHYFSLTPAIYKVVISKSGYSIDRSYGTDEIATPEKPHPMILEGQLTEVSFSIDEMSSMTVEARGTKGAGYPAIHNIIFTLTGAKTIGTDSDENPVYKYFQNHTTNGPGEIEIPNLEWDSYSFSVVSPGLDLIGIESPPGTETAQPVGLSPNASQIVRLILKAENSLLVTVQNIDTEEPIFSASIRLYNTDLGYDALQYTNENGQTYFIPLELATYNLEVSAAGYSDFATTVLVSGDVTETVGLEQVE